MALIDIWKTDRQQVQDKQIRQIIAFAGDGVLGDRGGASAEFREFMHQVPSSYLFRYVDECLADSFPKKKADLPSRTL